MAKEEFNFYSATNLKSYNLDESMRYQLNMLDSLDVFTRKHSENVANLTCRICEYMNCSPEFTVYCTTCAYLHDIGKLFIPAKILQKPEALTDEEFKIMQTHTTIGYNICMKDLKLRPYATGAKYHHEALDGSGYPDGLTKKDIPLEGQIIRVADEYDAIVSKRQYKSHIDISETLSILIADAKPSNNNKSNALTNLFTEAKVGKINPKVLRALFKVVIDDIDYERYCVSEYTDFLKAQIKRLEQIDAYNKKMLESKKEKDKQYYENGINLLLQDSETIQNYSTVLEEYRNTLQLRKEKLDKLNDEIKKIKKMKI